MDNLPITQSSTKVVDFTDNTKWTDKKHNLYLNSMEASFINQLYSSEYHSKDLVGWLSGTKASANKSFGQFKVFHKNCCDEVKFERTKTDDDVNKDSDPLSDNLWIQHFRPRSMSKEPLLSSAHEESCSKLTLPSAIDKNQDSVGSITEVSDQNFVDMETERGEKSRRHSKKRSRPAISTTNDQVVPFIGQTLDEEAKHNNRGDKKLEIMGEASQVGLPETSRFKDEGPIIS